MVNMLSSLSQPHFKKDIHYMDKAILVYQGHELRINVILASVAGTAPQFDVNPAELITEGHELWDEVKTEIKGDPPKLTKKQVIVTKYKTGYVVLLGDVTDAIKNTKDGDVVKVTLISSHALKRSRVSNEAEVEVPRSNPRPSYGYNQTDRDSRPRDRSRDDRGSNGRPFVRRDRNEA